MMKLTKFKDVPQFISFGQWECGFPLDRVLYQVDEWKIEYNLDIDPDFQRVHVWSECQQIAWMEYLLQGGRTGRTLYFNCGAWGWGRVRSSRTVDLQMVLVDGKQRLEAIRRFYANEILVFGSYYKEFTDQPDMLRGGMMLINVHDLPCRADVLRWYCQMNAGGTPHTKDEIERVRELLAQEKA